MRILNLLVISVVCLAALFLNGCVSERDYKALRIQNDSQKNIIKELRSELQATELQLQQAKNQLATIKETGGIESDALKQKIAALEEDIRAKKSLIASMKQQLLYGGLQLPAELSTMLEDFAKSQEMVTFDSNRGIVKFMNDLLFERGSDVVASEAAQAVEELCEILNSEQAKKFDVIIAGHTDDMRIARPETKAMHPTNWHLASHRAIAVLKVMSDNKIASERLSTRGFGEFRPAVPPKPKKVGTPENRRVEIYIVPQGM